MQGAGRGVVPGGVQRLNLDALARGHIGQPDAATAPASSPREKAGALPAPRRIGGTGHRLTIWRYPGAILAPRDWGARHAGHRAGACTPR